MTQARVERRLTAILAADVAGYSRLMGNDEEGTLTALKGYRGDIIDPKIAEHRGRIVNTAGDGLLAEFASAVDAVRCAMEIQRGLKGATITALLAFVALAAFALGVEAQERQPSVWPAKAWEVSTPEEQGMDSRAVARLIDDVGTYKHDSVLIVRNGRIVADAYYAPYVAGIRHDLRSVTKSFLSTAIGVLVQQGKLESVERPVLDFFPDRAIANLDERKRAITVQHLLDMSSGIAWVERVHTPDESLPRMYASPDPTGFVLDQPMSDPPGEKFSYKGGDTYLLSAIINKVTGQNALEFARRELLAPLGITDVRWAPIDKQGVVTGEAGMRLTPHDMARLGYLYLRDGVWDGKRIIPAAWVERVRRGRLATDFGKYANCGGRFRTRMRSWRWGGTANQLSCCQGSMSLRS